MPSELKAFVSGFHQRVISLAVRIIIHLIGFVPFVCFVGNSFCMITDQVPPSSLGVSAGPSFESFRRIAVQNAQKRFAPPAFSCG
jgi:hypothetical protein